MQTRRYCLPSPFPRVVYPGSLYIDREDEKKGDPSQNNPRGGYLE